MPVNTQHREYMLHLPRWCKVRALVDSDAHKFIKDIDKDDADRSVKYREDAVLTNFTARTMNGLVGLVFRKDPTVKLPPEIEYLKKDATGDNQSLFQCAKESVEETLITGRYGLLTDYPALNQKVNALELERYDLKARIYPYKAEEIINWCETIIHGRKVLTMVNIHECFTTLAEDEYLHFDDSRYITLRLVDGVYMQETYDHYMQDTGDFIPTKKNGEPFDEIPFSFVGARKNTPKCEVSPLYDIACLNISHLKNSASYEESIVVVGQPSLFITTSISTDEFMRLNPNGIKYGSRRGHNLGDSGSATLLQADPNQIADQGMTRKEAQAVMIGARLIQPSTGIETAEAARIRSASEISVLDSVATNNSEAFRKNIRWCAEFMGANPDAVEFDLNYEFFEAQADANLINAQIALLDRGIIAEKDLRTNIRKYGLIDPLRSDEQITADVGASNPL